MIDFELPSEKKYSARISRKTLMDIKKGVLKYVFVGKRYRNPAYSAAMLAEDIGVNNRYLSAALQLHFGCNFNELVNKYRIEDAKNVMLGDNFQLTMEELALSTGFRTRQSFYNAFSKFVGVKPKDWLEAQLAERREAMERERAERLKNTSFVGLDFE